MEKLIDGLSGFEIIKEGLDRHTRSRKHRCASHHIRRSAYHRLCHTHSVRPACSKIKALKEFVRKPVGTLRL